MNEALTAETVSTMSPPCRHRSGCTERALCSEAGYCCGDPKRTAGDELVTRLRQYETGDAALIQLLGAAADEIERLTRADDRRRERLREAIPETCSRDDVETGT